MAASTGVRLYRSPSVTNWASPDNVVGAGFVPSLGPNGTWVVTFSQVAPSTPGRYYYGVCVVTTPDRRLNNCSDAVDVTVTAADGSFTDDPIVAGETPVRRIHFTELRARIDGLRIAHGLGRFPWADPNLAARVTPVMGVHMSELRTALGQAYEAAGVLVGFDTAAVPGGSPIRAWHINDLRNAVKLLER